jgi:exodeoxyribonuclease V alpha subunit
MQTQKLLLNNVLLNTEFSTLIDSMLSRGRIRSIDVQLAKQVVDYEIQRREESGQLLTQTDATTLLLAVASVSLVLGRGQVCLPLSRSPLPEWQNFWPKQMAWDALLAACHVVAQINAEEDENNSSDEQPPLTLFQGHLYLSRYFSYERGVFNHIQQRLHHALSVNDSELATAIQTLFPSCSSTNHSATVDWQAVAATSACLQRFTVITGGPGTGKTTTVTRLLSALLSQNQNLSIALAAPTGKAAARMTESIRHARDHVTNGERIPDESFTLHRLLGWSPRGFKYHQGRPLPYDCVVVDEASMVDLPMMFHLFSALANDTRLILLGDQDQLASVEAGSVLADLCDAGTSHAPDIEFSKRLTQITGFDLTAVADQAYSPMQNAVAHLRVSYRFNNDSGIGRLAAAVNAGASAEAVALFDQYDDLTMTWHSAADGQLSVQPWQQRVMAGYQDYCRAVREKASSAEILQRFNDFQVLVAVRQGQFGVEETNRQIERLLKDTGMLPLSLASANSAWYPGRAVMITRNDYDLGLFNGDIGILIPDDAGDRVAFIASDGTIRYLLPSRLPPHESAFAMTVHKSQGSEFEHVYLMLPLEWQTVISRELIYTAITRAKTSFQCLTSLSCWQSGVVTQVERASGLRQALWSN